MNILHIIPSLRKGGAERLVLDIYNELQKRPDVMIRLVVLHPENEYEFLSKNIDIVFCKSKVSPSISGKAFVDIADFETIIADFKPDIIHSHLFEAEIISRWIVRSDIKYFTHCHNNMGQFRRLASYSLFSKELLTNYYEKRLLVTQYLKCNNKFIAISKDTESFFKQALPKKLSQNVILLNNAIDFNRFKHTIHLLKTKENHSINLITVGSLIEIKNHLFLLEVISLLNKRSKLKFNLTIIGEGVFRENIEKKIIENQLENIVTLLGKIDNVEDFLQKADLYVFSCIKEGFGLTLIEAMASGLPVICLDGKGNRDIIEDGKNGFMIYKNNPELFANKIIELVNNPELYQSMSKYAVEFAKKYDIKEYVDRLLKIYSA
jgi:glycosyltransferase involved in cell wall biosynthesis